MKISDKLYYSHLLKAIDKASKRPNGQTSKEEVRKFMESQPTPALVRNADFPGIMHYIYPSTAAFLMIGNFAKPTQFSGSQSTFMSEEPANWNTLSLSQSTYLVSSDRQSVVRELRIGPIDDSHLGAVINGVAYLLERRFTLKDGTELYQGSQGKDTGFSGNGDYTSVRLEVKDGRPTSVSINRKTGTFPGKSLIDPVKLPGNVHRVTDTSFNGVAVTAPIS